MSDNLENFIRNNRDAFDAQVPSDQIWTNIQAGIAQQAAATAATTTASSAAGAAAKSGLAKIALGWKIAAITAFSAIVAAGIYFVAGNGDQKADGNGAENLAATTSKVDENAPTTKAEYLYDGATVIAPPMPGSNVAYLEYDVNVGIGGKFTTPTGTELSVPANVFVDANGQPITGDVQLRYREFHDAEDVIMSGITMKYNEHGEKGDFQTAGMMEILGYQDGKQIFIAPGKTVDVKMASFTSGDDYNLYFLDTKDGWKNIGKAKMTKNKQKEDGLRLVAAKPRPPVKGKTEEMDGEVMFNAKRDEFPELRPFKGVRWMAEDQKDYAAKEDKIISKVWSDVKLEELDDEGLRYRIHLTHKSGATMDVDVKPILEGDDYEKGMKRFQEKMDKYNKMLAQKGVDEERLATQADVFRSFSVSGFGVFNCDRIYRMSKVMSLTPDFVFSQQDYLDPAKTVIYHIVGENRAVLTLMPGERQAFKWSPLDVNRLVVVLPGNKVGVVTPDKFKALEKSNGKSAKIEFEPAVGEVHSAMDLRKILGV